MTKDVTAVKGNRVDEFRNRQFEVPTEGTAEISKLKNFVRTIELIEEEKQTELTPLTTPHIDSKLPAINAHRQIIEVHSIEEI